MTLRSRFGQAGSILQRQVSIFLFALAALVQVSLPIADQAYHRANGQTEYLVEHEGGKTASTKQDGSSGTLPDSHEHDCPICQAMLHGAGAALVPEQVVFTATAQVDAAAMLSRSTIFIAARPETAARPRAPPNPDLKVFADAFYKRRSAS